MNLIPAIDILDGKCVRLIQGDYDQETVFSDDPVEFAVRWSSYGAKWMHIIDLDGARAGKLVNEKVVEKIINVSDCSIQIGGGIRNYNDFSNALNNGVNRVIVGTIAIKDKNLLQSLITDFSDELIVSIDSRDGLVQVEGWTESTQLESFALIQELAQQGVKRIIYTDVERDGTNEGINFKNIEKIVSSSHIPIIAAGGISSLDDLKSLKSCGVEGAILGRALFDGKIDLEEAINLIS
ncbi:MAG: 1-(5-phosphoribosyl)-5-[(5-phosphoribosylamino)methylideneamino]imidazole-4-carboxamide isomerase [Dehalococcoidia bacterium]|nr:1-(5-phosphoribosyl)-5-[(5-phosphoribosylamino)methylideneamino]imidazole-4-carboxamide isomerase [Dehalococcoidia bacterium]